MNCDTIGTFSAGFALGVAVTLVVGAIVTATFVWAALREPVSEGD